MLGDLKDCLQYFGGSKAELQADRIDEELRRRIHERNAGQGSDSDASKSP